MKYEQTNGRATLAGPILVCGFAAAVALWCAWFVSHLPWMGLSEQMTLPLLGGIWAAALGLGASRVPKTHALKIGTLAGLDSAIIGLLVLGSKLTQAPDAAGVSAGLKPSAGLIAVGFLFLGTILGLCGGAIGWMLNSNPPPLGRDRWLGRFAVVACVAIAPLLFVGGLVTSTNSGMAVPDWPNTFGSNMFLYPLGPRSEPGRYLEHSHRLFGTLVGLTVLTLMVLVFLWEKRTSLKILAAAAFVLVVGQGLLGAWRVLKGSTVALQDNRFLSMAHGVLAQLVFGVVVALAVFLSHSYRTYGSGTTVGPAAARKAKFLTTALFHSLILQLLLGAAYRHLRHNHALWAHIGFSIIVLVFAVAAGFALTAAPIRASSAGKTLSNLGKGLVAVVTLQFLLGWAAFGFGGRALEAGSVTEALIRTVHQANGAVLLALATAAFLWGRRLTRSAQQTPESPELQT